MLENIIIVLAFPSNRRWATVKSSLGNHEFTVAQRRFKPHPPEMSKK